MMNRLNPCISIPFGLSTDEFQDLIKKTKDWTLMHGGGIRSKNNFSSDSLTVVPFTLLPSVFPKNEFLKAVKIQPLLNELMHKVSRDHEFLKSCLKKTIEVDEFTRKLFTLYETVREEGITQRMSLGLLRSDIMHQMDENGNNIKQVELNTIACGFGWLGILSGNIHRFVLQQLGFLDKLKMLPENNALQGLCLAIIKAWELFNDKNSIVLIVVEDQSVNICDQRFHEFELALQKPELCVIRKTLTQVANEAKLTHSKDLVIQSKRVAVVYYRSGYSPEHYHGEIEWLARLLIERSTAIKCPDIQYHLAGTKKVQQELAKTGVLERFINDPNEVVEIRHIFTGLFSLDLDQNGDNAVKMALDNPENFVLKPQREGGGNNLYNDEIKEKLMSCINSKERSAWILMEKICPPVQQNYLIRHEVESKTNLTPCDVVSELGIFGIILCDGDNILLNEQVGHMMRTKSKSCNEGGVNAGYGVLDSPFLYDDSSDL
ncbi:glutathione synthetase-like isoform X2 [Daktulosphaira vitifoliae]|nr:glutathione synthetase-like isoform X2 [Daktulosphaira vitifoliae]XP_050522042.1 glutathione synthetase-like isoform X2 [Daktulosphaira vitifoliae]XP_050522043.1 glutathione synthetase-like isoform X2 [Daktulosphaira vitifoliae]XP_050522044.1 glutathione synthetase-like isoform X2 [Daktulosphaira vitifoliae]